jgi:hypothetical protein
VLGSDGAKFEVGRAPEGIAEVYKQSAGWQNKIHAHIGLGNCHHLRYGKVWIWQNMMTSKLHPIVK